MSEITSKLPLKKALLYIFLSVFIVSGSSAIGLFYYKYIREKQKEDSTYDIVAIIQSTPNVEKFKTVYLAELLRLSIDYPTNLYTFNVDWAKKQILQSPVIKEVNLFKILPGTILVDYVPRHPIAFLADYTNTAVDEDGVPFPFNPFFTPKNLPQIYLNRNRQGKEIEKMTWGVPIKNEHLDLAFNLFKAATTYCSDTMSSLLRIDVSEAFALSYGQRQLVLIFEERIPKIVKGHPILWTDTHTLRLSPHNYSEQLANYLVLRAHLREHPNRLESMDIYPGIVVKEKGIIIDLRLSQLAFITKEQ